MQKSREQIKEDLFKGNYAQLRRYGDDKNMMKHVNDQSDIGKLTLLHEVIRSQKYKFVENSKKEAIECLFAIGIKPSIVEVNGDTPLHTSIYKNVDEDVLRALLYSKHSETFHKPCMCGFEALLIANNRKQLPREVGNITLPMLKILNEAGK